VSETRDPQAAVQEGSGQESTSPPTPARRAMALLATGVMALSAAQFLFAGFGAFGGGYTPHLIIGWIIAALSILVLGAAVAAHVERSYLFSAVALVVLAVVVAPLAVELTGRGASILSTSFSGAPKSWLGAAHAFVGLVIFGTAGRIMAAGRPAR